MSTYALTMMDRASTLVGGVIDLQDILDWIEEEVEDGHMPSLDELADRIDSQHPSDVEFRFVRTQAGGVALAVAAESFTETDAMDGLEVIASSRQMAASAT